MELHLSAVLLAIFVCFLGPNNKLNQLNRYTSSHLVEAATAGSKSELLLLTANSHQSTSAVDETQSSSSSSAQVAGPTSLSQISDTTPHATLISVRNALAFWRQSDLLSPAPTAASNKATPGRPKCAHHQIAPTGQFAPRAPFAYKRIDAEIVAVEGSSIRINCAIRGLHLGPAATQPQHDGVYPSAPAKNKLIPPSRLHWIKNGQPLVVKSASKSSSSSSTGSFSQLIVSNANAVQQRHNQSKSVDSNSKFLVESTDQSFEFQMLAPFVNERHLARVADSGGKLLDMKTMQILKSKSVTWVDNFIGDTPQASTVDWTRLGAYLERNFAAADEDLSVALGCEPHSDDDDKLSVVQVELAQLTRNDRGLYQLHFRNSCGDQQDCGSSVLLAFSLQIVEDIPKFVLDDNNTQQHLKRQQLLEPNERLSIKCQATGFTLPQITWFLDNQQLSENHPESGTTRLASASMGPGLALGPTMLLEPHQQHPTKANQPQTVTNPILSRLRIGDYVSQDNHVHSYVNSSHVQLSDGGYYKCQANNGFHTIEHEIRIDVRGPPLIARPMGNMSVLTGQNQLLIQCPYSGYPIRAIEWYFRPWLASQQQVLPLDDDAGGFRSRRSYLALDSDEDGYFDSSSSSNSDADQPPLGPDLDRDEWLAQASAMTPPPPEEYPDPMPEDPKPASNIFVVPADYEAVGSDADYSDWDIDLQQQANRKRREIPHRESWIKLPQSRRHLVHSNGSLILQDISRSDQGFYKCRVVAPQSDGGAGDSKELNLQQADIHDEATQALEQAAGLAATSNEFYLNVMVAPVISPFASADTLREGMRNFLTCSVIEGDAPVSLGWLKDEQPIEEYIATWPPASQMDQPRIRVETSNEFTSTVYFSHVDFRDNGNYTCMATNKAASVNYTTRMLVNVAPKWLKAPKDVECVSGQNIVIDCQAQAHPNPRVWWEIGVYNPIGTLTSASSSSSSSPSSSASRIDQSQSSHNTNHLATLAPSLPSSLANNLTNFNQQNDHHYAPNHYRTIISNSRIHILENASLVIRDVARSDAGYYLCQAANNFGSLSSLIKLTVNVGASFANKYQVKYVKLNEHVELDCDPIGQSPVDVTWYMRSLSSSSSSQNRTQLINSSSTPESVRGRRLFMATIKTDLHQSKESNAQAQLISTGQGYLARASIVDPKTGEPNSDSSSSVSFELLTRNDQLKSEFVRLSIKQVHRIHSGEFVCLANNKHGSDEKLIKLLVQEQPDIVQELSIVQVDSRSVSLAWSPPFNGNSPISSYSVEWTPHDGAVGSHPAQIKWFHITVQQTATILSGLEPMTSYEIRVRAHNQIGQSANGPQLLVTTAEEAPGGPPIDIRATALSSSSLQLSWLPPGGTGPPPDLQVQHPHQTVGASKARRPISIKGYYLGYKVANSNDSYLFKTVSLMDSSNGLSGGGLQQDGDQLLAMPGDTTRTNGSTVASASATAIDKRRVRVIIDDLKRSTKYSVVVSAFNSAGPGPQSDRIDAKTLLNDPPPAPLMRLGLVTYTSIELLWTFQADLTINVGLERQHYQSSQSSDFANNPPTPLPLFSRPTMTNLADSRLDLTVDGYHLFYRQTNDPSGVWSEKKLAPDTHTMIGSGHRQSGAGGGSSSDQLTIIESDDKAALLSMASDFSADSKSASGPPQFGWPKNLTSSSSSHSGSFKSFRYTLDQLVCGNSYQLYLVAYNSIGSSQPSSVIQTKTRGSAPIAPRKQDYLAINSSYVQINLDAWMDGGCSITNIGIKYKPLPAKPSQPLSPTELSSTDSQWILLSNNMGPDQRAVELRDLTPETWYSILTSAESAAGKTEAIHSFMTLDKFGRVSPEAIEASSLPAILRGNGSLRSIFLSFSNPNNPTSPLLLSACICILLFATCSLFFIRRYNTIAKDNASVDSRTTSEALSPHYGLQPDLHHHHTHHHLMSSSGPTSDESTRGDYGRHTSPPHEKYSLKASPCKTSTTIVTGSSSSNEAPSSIMENGAGPMFNHMTHADHQTVDLSHFMGDDHSQCARFQTGGYCANLCAETTANKFASMSRGPMNMSQHNRFKTMPHPGQMNRPVSTFVSTTVNPSNFQTLDHVNRQAWTGTLDQQQANDYQHQMLAADAQQVYSKLRLIYNNTNSAFDQVDATGGPKPIDEMPANDQSSSVFISNGFEFQPTDAQTANGLSNLIAMNDQKMDMGCNYGRYVQQSADICQVSGCEAQSIISGSNSSNITNSTHPTQSASSGEQSNTNSSNNNQLISMTSHGQNSNQKINSDNQQPQQNHDQSDYALPFHPKWV